MRPNSVITFERLYLVSLAIVVAQQIAGYFLARDVFARMPNGQELSTAMNSAILLVIFAFVFLLLIGIPLLLWWLAARKRVEVAKWLLVAVSVISILYWLAGALVWAIMPIPPAESAAFDDVWNVQPILIALDGLSELIGVVALVFLFRRDATEWFRTATPNVKAETFR